MDIGKSISQSFEIFKNNIGLLIGATFVAVVLSGCTLGFLAGPLLGGLFLIYLKLVRGEKAEFSEIFAHFDKFVPCLFIPAIAIALIITYFILALIPFLGWFLLFLLEIALGVASPLITLVFMIALGKIMEENMDAIEAIKYGYSAVKDNLVMNWVYALVFSAIGGAGAVVCGVGMYVTLPMLYLGMALAYLKLTGSAVQAPPNDVAPSV